MNKVFFRGFFGIALLINSNVILQCSAAVPPSSGLVNQKTAKQVVALAISTKKVKFPLLIKKKKSKFADLYSQASSTHLQTTVNAQAIETLQQRKQEKLLTPKIKPCEIYLDVDAYVEAYTMQPKFGQVEYIYPDGTRSWLDCCGSCYKLEPYFFDKKGFLNKEGMYLLRLLQAVSVSHPASMVNSSTIGNIVESFDDQVSQSFICRALSGKEYQFNNRYRDRSANVLTPLVFRYMQQAQQYQEDHLIAYENLMLAKDISKFGKVFQRANTVCQCQKGMCNCQYYWEPNDFAKKYKILKRCTLYSCWVHNGSILNADGKYALVKAVYPIIKKAIQERASGGSKSLSDEVDA